MFNIKLVRDQSQKPTTETIKWTQAKRCLFGCKEDYRLVDYYQDGNEGRKFKVYVNQAETPLTPSGQADTKENCILGSSLSRKVTGLSSL